ncbi:MAG: ATP-binding protein, partial [Rikenellaceae bacterium]|nr:ATP-binding protein [Rikenellaceae bacterium]
MKRIWVIGSIIFLALYSRVALADNLSFRQITTQDGLSQNTVRAILADQQGFIWAGTVDGLNRYNGNNFIVFKPRLGAPSPLTENRIRNLHEDRNGYIWARMYNNSYACYDPKTERFISFFYEGEPLALNFTEYYESSTGSIWLSGSNGCVRLDKLNGEHSVTFLSSPQNPVLAHERVLFLREDFQGNIWFGTQNGLNRLTPEGKLEHFLGETGQRFIRAVEVNRSLYFMCSSGMIYRYDTPNGRFEPIDTPIKNLSYAQKLDDRRILILTQNHEIWLYHLSDNRFQPDPFQTIPSNGQRNRVVSDNKGGVWYYNHTGTLWYCNPPDGGSRRLDLIPAHILSVIDEERYSIFIDSKNNYWITTYGNGLFLYDPQENRLQHYTYSDRTNSLSTDYLHSITEDASGNIWIGTEYAGMVKITPQKQEITAIYPENHYSVGSSNNVRGIFEDEAENIWIGTKNGSLYFYDRTLSHGYCVREKLNPYTITQDTLGNLWIGTKGNGLVVYDPREDRIVRHFRKHASVDSLSHQDVFNLLRDRSGRIWAATFGGGLCLAVMEQGEISFRRYFSGSGNRSRIRYLLEDSRGYIWCGTYAGLLRFDPDELQKNPQQFEVSQFDPLDLEGLNCNDIKTIYETSAGEIWIGTAGGGLNKLIESAGGKFRYRHYTSQDGLPGDMITAIMESPDSTLWVSTESGLAQFIPRNEHFVLHRISENTFGNFYNENACFLRRNGQMLWGTLNGVIGFDPKGFVKNGFSPKVTFTDFYLFDERAETGMKDSPLVQSITFTENIRLKHHQNTFTIGYALLNLTDPEMNRYSYILESYDKAWSPAFSNGKANYKNLPPGRYIFRVRGANADGEWTEEPARLEIRVMPPFWKTGWAYFIYTILLFTAIYIAYRLIYKFNHLNNAVRMEKKLTEYKLRFFTNISHEFRTPLTLISGVTENLMVVQDRLPAEAQHQLRLLERNTRQMRRLIDQLLEFRKIQNTTLALNLEKVDLEKFVWEIYTAFRETAKQKTIDYRFSCQLTEQQVYVDREKLEKILFNLLSNAFKFTSNEGTIEIDLSENRTNHSWKIAVKDNGYGIPKEKRHLLFSRFMQLHFSAGGTGVGLSLVKELVETHKGTIS